MGYQSWPLGNLPREWQRPEPSLIKEKGYEWEDPRDIIGIFEDKLAKFAGSKFAVLTDCCSNALFLALQFRLFTKEIKFGQEIEIPCKTYASVPMQIIHSGLKPVFTKIAWSGAYELKNANIFDSAARFTEGMYPKNESLHVLSFQIKKRLPIGKGGAILTNSPVAYNWLKLASYDGRNLNTEYTSQNHIQMMGWHYYMTPEDAARGILIMDQLPRKNPDTMSFDNYIDLSALPLFRDYKKKDI
jgi:dTDP-4-amino-4,6-dideoxygalactose transaminase